MGRALTFKQKEVINITYTATLPRSMKTFPIANHISTDMMITETLFIHKRRIETVFRRKPYMSSSLTKTETY